MRGKKVDVGNLAGGVFAAGSLLRDADPGHGLQRGGLSCFDLQPAVQVKERRGERAAMYKPRTGTTGDSGYRPWTKRPALQAMMGWDVEEVGMQREVDGKSGGELAARSLCTSLI